MLKRAAAAGQIERVRRGLYVSKTGLFALSSVDPFELISTIDPDAVFSFHSALEAHGVAHNIESTCQFRSAKVKTPFRYSYVSYVPFPFTEGLPAQKIRGEKGLRIKTTTREQTIIDCLSYPNRCGGIEEALLSISLFSYIDVDALKELVSVGTASLASRVGWLLEQKADKWRVSEDVLREFETMAKGGPFKLDKDSIRSQGWSRRWKLCLPAEEGEVKAWVA